MPVSEPYEKTLIPLLKDEETAFLYLEETLATGDMAAFRLALKDVAKAHPGGIAALAQKTDLSREHLYRTLSPKGNPRLDTLNRVLQALDLRISVAKSNPAG